MAGPGRGETWTAVVERGGCGMEDTDSTERDQALSGRAGIAATRQLTTRRGRAAQVGTCTSRG